MGHEKARLKSRQRFGSCPPGKMGRPPTIQDALKSGRRVWAYTEARGWGDTIRSLSRSNRWTVRSSIGGTVVHSTGSR